MKNDLITANYSPRYYRRCEETLKMALDHVPAYAKWRQFDPGTSCDIDLRFRAMPALTKHDLRMYTSSGFVSPGFDLDRGLNAGEIEMVATSGATSDRVANVWFQEWWDSSERESWKLNNHIAGAASGLHREAILASPMCVGMMSERGVLLPMEQRRLGRYLYLCEIPDPSQWTEELMDRMVEELLKFRPAVLESNPSFLARLSRHIAAHGSSVFQPGCIVLTYEYPSVLHYRQIRQSFSSPVLSSYGSTEAAYVLMECEYGQLHQVSESCRIDFIPLRAGRGDER